MKKNILIISLTLLLFAGKLLAAPPTYPLIIDELPAQPSLKATIQLTNGTTLKDLLILSNNEETDPGSIALRFFRPPLKSAVYIRDLKSIGFEKVEGERGLYEGDLLAITLKSGKKDTVEYISGLNDGFTIIYLDDFTGTYQKLYIPLYTKAAGNSDLKKLHIKQVTFLN